jgi:protein-S-isoprenylcysteine O-methyltransferase Ste14
MKLKGFDHLARHVPELNSTSGRIKITASFLGIFGLTTLYFILTDNIPTWTLDSQIVVMALGFLLLSLFFTQKEKIIATHGDAAYRYAFGRFNIPGLALIFAAIAHTAYMNGPKFTQPAILNVFTWLGWLNVVIGTVLWLRSVATFGVDNLTMLYVYSPAESRMVNSSIYKTLRHPIYGAAIYLCLGLALLNAGIYPLTFILFLPLGFFGWVRLVEEKELLERIPEYAEYRKKVPAFFPYPTRILDFFKFLFTGK